MHALFHGITKYLFFTRSYLFGYHIYLPESAIQAKNAKKLSKKHEKNSAKMEWAIGRQLEMFGWRRKWHLISPFPINFQFNVAGIIYTLLFRDHACRNASMHNALLTFQVVHLAPPLIFLIFDAFLEIANGQGWYFFAIL